MKSDRPSGGTVPRSVRAPERTGAEQAWLDQAAERGDTLTFHLDDGSAVRGTVEEHDGRTIRVREPAGVERMIYRRAIRAIEE